VAGTVLIAAGGTGGHLFPAEALAIALKSRGFTIHLATDDRVEAYGQDFPAERIHIVPSATITKAPLEAARALMQLGKGVLKARGVIAAVKPTVAIGFGGYPTLPPLFAATLMRVPTIIHDQNAVLGRANKFLAKRVTAVATSFPNVGGAEGLAGKMVETGNPVRPMVLAAAGDPYQDRWAGDPFRLLVFGGSQGARFMSDLVPPALGKLPEILRKKIRLVQQCRSEDIERVAEACRGIGVETELAPFFRDLPARIAAAHVVVSRAGASTVAELAVIGRPAVMVPLPHALDQDQKANAEILAKAGGGWMVEQADMSPERLAHDLAEMIGHPDRLAAAARAAKTVGRPDAVERLADLVERVAAGKPLEAEG
jgi:UDP-N-acetylglucosamine--N-acetylmuramyl-(pentapeptide) pyrophosphoryl-undecaprenol N-acetylglucosamine transferase